MDLPLKLIKGFCVIISRHTSLRREVDRSLLVLELAKANPHQTAKRLNCNKQKAYRWYHRTERFIEAFANKIETTDAGIERLLREFLKDKQRTGTPLFYAPEQQCAIVSMATEKPREYGIESDSWTHRELALASTRTAKDFAALIENTVNLDSEAEWIFISDQLNTHKSEELVRLFAKQMDIKDGLGEKGESGILKNLHTRECFLADKSHRIRFVYTPKHCSWLNQIEIWFGILTRKILRQFFRVRKKLK